MYITCPNCGTAYNVDGHSISANGRAVRCFNCDHRWRQFPVAAQPVSGTSSVRYTVPPPPPPQYSAPPPYADPRAYGHLYSYPPQAPPHPPYPTYPGAVSPVPQAVPGSMAMSEQHLGFVPESRLEPNVASMADSETDFEDIPLTEPDDDIRPEPDGDGEGGNLPSDEELEAMFGEDDELEVVPSLTPEPDQDPVEMSEEELEDLEDPEPIESLAPDTEEQIEVQEIEPDDIPDPDPIPMAFPPADATEDATNGKSSRTGLILSLIVFILLAGVLTGASIMRETVVAYWSGANTVFSLVGLRVPQPGDGLDLRFTDPKRDEKNEDKIIINLIVENMTEESQLVPDVINRATDANGTVVQEIITQPPKRTLKPGETIRFRAVFEKVAPTAKDISIPNWGQFPLPDEDKKKQN